MAACGCSKRGFEPSETHTGTAPQASVVNCTQAEPESLWVSQVVEANELNQKLVGELDA